MFARSLIHIMKDSFVCTAQFYYLEFFIINFILKDFMVILETFLFLFPMFYCFYLYDNYHQLSNAENYLN